MTTETNPLAELIAGVDDEEVMERAELVDLLYQYDRWRAQESSAKAEKEKIAERLKQWLKLHPEDTLWDGERGIEASFKTRSGPERYDVASMPYALVKALHKNNALSVDVAVVRANSGKATWTEDVKPYRVPGMETTALEVKVKA